MQWIRQFRPDRAIAVAGLAMLAACATPPPPPPPPPPPAPAPAPVEIPPRPSPPNSSAADTPIPPIGPDGVRQTVNANLSTAQTVWNLRSGLNVAALNCLDPEDGAILEAYKQLLDRHVKQLAEVYKTTGSEFRQKYGREFETERDRYSTQVYNYFALPPAGEGFCDAALQLSQAYLQAPPEDLEAYAMGALAQLDAPFQKFFEEFEAYRVAVAAWDAQYAPVYAVAVPAPVQVPDLALNGPSPDSSFVPLSVPVVDAPSVVQMVSQPVVQSFGAGDQGDGGR